MAAVITFAQQKGGAGKTMLAAQLAAAYAAEARVALLDTDPQGSLARWHALRSARASAAPLTFAAPSGWRLPAELDRLRGTHDLILIDSPPRVDTDARIAVRAADLVVVPLQPSPPDLWAAGATLDLVQAERRRAVMVLNRAPATSKLRSAMERALAERGLTVCAGVLGNRAGFAAAFAEGLGVTEAWPRSPAAREVHALAAEIRAAITARG
jgi:chromosome partitioning protein